MRRGDILLISVCLLAALILGIFFAVHRKSGGVVTISCDGMELYRIELNEIASGQQPQYYLVMFYDEQDVHIMHFEDYPELPEDKSYNLFTVADSTVTMEAADCRDQICVNHKPIMSERESIICLPHRLVVEMSGSGKEVQAEPKQNNDRNSEKNIDEPLDGMVR